VLFPSGLPPIEQLTTRHEAFRPRLKTTGARGPDARSARTPWRPRCSGRSRVVGLRRASQGWRNPGDLV